MAAEASATSLVLQSGLSLVSAVIGGTIALAGQWALRRAQHSRETLIDRYSEFVGLASQEWNRARSLAAGIVIAADKANLEVLAELEPGKRLELNGELSRVALQIELLETNAGLRERVTRLVNSQPFQPFLLPVNMNRGDYNQRLEKFETQTREYGEQIRQLVAEVRAIHRIIRWWSRRRGR